MIERMHRLTRSGVAPCVAIELAKSASETQIAGIEALVRRGLCPAAAIVEVRSWR